MPTQILKIAVALKKPANYTRATPPLPTGMYMREDAHTHMAEIRATIIFISRSVVTGLAVAFVVILLKPGLIPFGSQEPDPQATGISTALSLIPDAVAKAAPAVINIYTTRVAALSRADLRRQRLGLGRPGASTRRLVTSLGSGVIIDPRGLIVTNNHLVANAQDIKIQLADGRISAPQIIGMDADTDLALLQIDLPDLPAIQLGRSDGLRIGEFALAIGNPYGLSQSVTQGIISATGRTELGLTLFENFIQTDAAINRGNSGGALINLRGELIGINTAAVGGEDSAGGIGFAIPVNLVRGVIQQLEEHGRVRRGWLGVVPQDPTDQQAIQPRINTPSGVTLADVYRDSPAWSAGLRRGDIITHLNDEPIHLSRQALSIVASLMPGDLVSIQGTRAGEQFSIQTLVTERP